MSKPTCASLDARLTATVDVLNTYIALHQGLEAEFAAYKAAHPAPTPPSPKLYMPTTSSYAAQCAARRVAMARFMAANPGRKSATLQELMGYAV